MDIQLIGVSKSFNQKPVLNNLTLTFREGRRNCLMGPSGIGKTTVTNLILGLIRPDAGTIKGCEGKGFAAVFQEDRLIEHWDAVDNIKLVCDKSVTGSQINNELRAVGLSNVDGKAVRDFSGGMRRRVTIVRALMAKSEILILDEPLKGLDEELKNQIIDYIKEKTKGKTVIIVTHDKEELLIFDANLVSME